MSELRVVVPIKLARKLERKHLSEKMMLDAVKKPILDALESLAQHVPTSPIHAAGANIERVRSIILELRGGSAPSMDEPFIGDVTLGQWLAMSEAEQAAHWDKLEEKEWKKLEKNMGMA